MHRVCPVCGSNAVSRALEAKDHTVSKQTFEIWGCQDCSFRFTQAVPSPENIGKYYKSDTYVSHSNTKKGLVNRLYHAVRKRTLKQKLALVRQATGQMEGNLLDVGAGTGAFASVMQAAGWKVTGLEPDQDARHNALRDYQMKLEDLSHLFDLNGDTYDGITLWHVLEHVHQLHEYLDTFKRILTPDGSLIIAVPNYTSFDAQYYGRDWAAWDVPRHLWHFSPKSMEVLMKKHGLRVIQMLPMKFDSYYVSMLSEGYRHGKGNLFRAFLEGLNSNRKAAGDPKKFSSVIYIIKKADV
ncbi:Methyltransferase domain-containing protein [Arachidicoccus rhizosphaerae]|uniref:Methyltransferase domain-containing protein n=1 Tax=Arachidicoccus rhizosphaerae TaxID=551991 RepID=A0A1H3Y608_9BACT|nr:Methyltransferase domain-containing protein [Arachidicoccus rhizosphaerae]